MLDPIDLHRRHVDDLNCQIQTAFKIGSDKLFRDRHRMLSEEGLTWREPFVEFTPQYEEATALAQLRMPGMTPLLAGLMDSSPRFRGRPLFTHQRDALEAAVAGQNLVIATGTGSGKTESFLLPVFNRILEEAEKEWQAAADALQPGRFNERLGWQCNRSPSRPPGVRALVLYPTNALVNDQISRLRCYLSDPGAMAWQHNNLRGNFIYFGQYTSASLSPGAPSRSKARAAEEALGAADRLVQRLEHEAAGVASPDQARALRLLKSGRLPRTGTPEMLLRWDMQPFPPDVLVTNYSMLGYMLLRPIEAEIFDTTAAWLSADEGHVLTIVLDEAHTYTGARGTEVAFLIRRLRARLGARPDQVRVIATSATIGASPAELAEAQRFVGDLMDVDPSSVAPVRPSLSPRPTIPPSVPEAEACARYFDARKAGEDEEQACLVELFGSGDPNDLFRTMRAWGAYGRCGFGASSAKPFAEFSRALWDGLGLTPEDETRATAGFLALATYARPDPDAPPLLPTRLHMWFRQLPGLWACLNPTCGAGAGPLGRLQASPDPWCECGSRVLEFYTCRVCGLAFVAGFPDPITEQLWPFAIDDRGREEDLAFFCVEAPVPSEAPSGWIDPASTLPTQAESGRPVYAHSFGQNATPRPTINALWSPAPSSCPRCETRTSSSRAAVENHRGKGFGSLVQLSEVSFRTQEGRAPAPDGPPSSQATNNPFARRSRDEPRQPRSSPTGSRKLLVFSDGRQLAARLAVELEHGHSRTVFRQLIVRTTAGSRDPISMDDLRERVFRLAAERGIDLSFGEVGGYWSLDHAERKLRAEVHFDRMMRREIADREVALERLGLGSFGISVEDPSAVPPLGQLSPSETLDLINVVLGVLARQNCVLPVSGDYHALRDYTERWERGVVMQEATPAPAGAPFDALHWPGPTAWQRGGRRSRLARALESLALAAGASPPAFAAEIWRYLMNWLRPDAVCPIRWNTQSFPDSFAIALNAFSLKVTTDDLISVCPTCGYLSLLTFRDTCTRCGARMSRVTQSSLFSLSQNAYRSAALLAAANELDPFPLNSREHSGQIETSVGQRYERLFQDLFIDDEVPLESRIDILSVTTTMEMGIDIGELSAVALSNIPPGVANYQQRAGRAGRRADRLATVVALGRSRSHDTYYWDRPTEMLTGQVRTPRLSLHSEAIAQRHFFAVVLGRFGAELHAQGVGGQSLFEVLGAAADWVSGPTPYVGRLRQRIQDARWRQAMLADGEAALPSPWWPKLQDWLDRLPDEIQVQLARNSGAPEALPALIRGNVLPRFGFPVDVVSLESASQNWERAEELQRDLQIAIGEYAPGAEVVADRRVHRSIGLLDRWADPPNYAPQEDFAYCQDCQAVTLAPHAPGTARSGLVQCQECQSNRIRSLPFVRPVGFKTDGRPRRYRGGGLDWAGSAGEPRLAPGRSALRAAATPELAVTLAVEARTDEIFLTNFGPDFTNPGFEICAVCGEDIAVAQGHARRCQGQATRVALLHRFITDVLVVAFDIPATFHASMQTAPGQTIWRSVATALARAASPALQIDPDELKVGVRTWNAADPRRLGELFIYDDVPNGAGYSRQIGENLPELLRAARDLMQVCTCGTACYACLLDYRNQFWHGSLDRFAAVDALNLILDGTTPVASRQRGEHCARVLARILADLGPAQETDALGRHGVLVNGSLFITVIPSMVDPAVGTASVGSRTVRCREVSDFNVLRQPIEAIRAVRAVLP